MKVVSHIEKRLGIFVECVIIEKKSAADGWGNLRERGWSEPQHGEQSARKDGNGLGRRLEILPCRFGECG